MECRGRGKRNRKRKMPNEHLSVASGTPSGLLIMLEGQGVESYISVTK